MICREEEDGYRVLKLEVLSRRKVIVHTRTIRSTKVKEVSGRNCGGLVKKNGGVIIGGE